MKRIKSIFSFALAVLLFVFSVSVPAGASAFPDVYSTTTYLDAINYVSDNGIMVGEEGGYFNPQQLFNPRHVRDGFVQIGREARRLLWAVFFRRSHHRVVL